jgi:hypothetical protein
MRRRHAVISLTVSPVNFSEAACQAMRPMQPAGENYLKGAAFGLAAVSI